jgi:hypothetical protein
MTANSRGILSTFVAIWIGFLWYVPVLPASTLPTADEVLRALNVSERDQEKIRQGHIVQWTVSEGSDRELGIGMAFLVKTTPANLVNMFHEAAAFKKVPVITAHGRIQNGGKLADFARLKLEPNGKKEARRYLGAEPGNDLNLDAQERAAFHTLNPAGGTDSVPVEKVEALIQQTLLSRYQAYRANGFSGIAPYERKDGQRLFPSDELTLSVKQMKHFAKYVPAVYEALLHYPAGKSKDVQTIEEQFFWLNVDVFGRPLYVLSHRTLYQINDVYVATDCHYYTTHDYNSMVQGVAALPTDNGVLLIYLGRVSTDQVAGFASKALHPVSRAIAAPYIKDMFETIQAEAKKQ